MRRAATSSVQGQHGGSHWVHLLSLTGLQEEPASHQTHCKFSERIIRVRLYWDESEIDIASRWLHRESNLLITMGSEKDQ